MTFKNDIIPGYLLGCVHHIYVAGSHWEVVTCETDLTSTDCHKITWHIKWNKSELTRVCQCHHIWTTKSRWVTYQTDFKWHWWPHYWKITWIWKVSKSLSHRFLFRKFILKVAFQELSKQTNFEGTDYVLPVRSCGFESNIISKDFLHQFKIGGIFLASW